jgi:hypothetical protein
MSDTRVTRSTTQPTSDGGANPHKIRIPGSDGMPHTNPSQILAPRPVQRAARATLPSRAIDGGNVATVPVAAPTAPLSAQEEHTRG